MTDAFYYKFGSFAPQLETSWERLMMEMKNEPERNRELVVMLNHDSTRGAPEQTEMVFR